ncbi:MAG: DivIVA domain-containing protein [Mobilitalea sp.]
MFTPSDIHEKVFKTGIGFDKKDVEQFLNDLSSDFEELQQENNDLKIKIKDLNDSLSYYRSIEKTLQRALILAEKTAQDTRSTALREADAIELEARTNAKIIIADSKNQKEMLEHKTLNLMQQYDLFKIHFENLLHAQIELINSKSFSLNNENFSYNETVDQGKLSSITRNPADLNHTLDTSSLVPVTTQENELSPENKDQIHFDFHLEEPNKSYQTEDGFEFFTINEN